MVLDLKPIKCQKKTERDFFTLVPAIDFDFNSPVPKAISPRISARKVRKISRFQKINLMNCIEFCVRCYRVKILEST